jgi:hypothetical protein
VFPFELGELTFCFYQLLIPRLLIVQVCVHIRACSGILANLISLMWEIQYMLNFNLPALLRACVVCAKKKVYGKE